MSKQQRGLGKGLGALLGGDADLSQIRKPVGYVNKQVVSTVQQPQDTSDILRIPVDMIEPNPFQPRMSFDQEALEELSESIKTLGLIQPITVRRKEDGRYQIISGERRFRASRLAGMTMIPAYIRDANDQGMLEMAIVENIQRENLDPIEGAMSYQRLIEECNLTQEQMAIRVGKKRASVTNFLRLLKLPEKVLDYVRENKLSAGHARAIAAIDDEKTALLAAEAVIEKGLSVRETERMVKALTAEKKAKKASKSRHSFFDEVELSLNNSLGRKAKVITKEGKECGTLEIAFFDKDDLARIANILAALE